MTSERELWIILRARNRASRILRNFARDLEKISNELSKNFEDIDKSVKETDRSLQQISRRGFKDLEDSVVDVDDKMGKFFRNFRRGFSAFSKNLLGLRTIARFGLGGLVAAGVIISAVVGPILSLGSSIGLLVVALGLLTPVVLGLAVAVGSVLVSAFQSLGSAMEISEDIEDQKEKIAELTEKYGENSTQVKRARQELGLLQERFKEFDTLTRDMVFAIDNVKGAWKSLGEVISPVLFKGIPEDLNRLVLNAANFFGGLRGIAESINQLFKDFVEQVTQEEFVRAFQQFLRDGADALRNFSPLIVHVSDILQTLFRASGPHIAHFIQLLVLLIGRFSAWLQEAEESGKLDEIFTKGLEILTLLLDLMGPLTRIMLAFFLAGNDEGKPFLETLVEMTEAIAEFFESADGQEFIKFMIKGAMVTATIVGTVLALIAVILMLGSVLTGVFVDGLKVLVDAFKETWNDIKSGARDFGESLFRLAQKIRDWWNDVVDFFRRKTGVLLGFFNKDLLFNAGKDIIQGLIDGISNKFGDLKNKLKFVADNVSGTFKNVLGIGSPSKVFASIGRDIQRGLILGLAGEERKLMEIMRTSAATLSGAGQTGAQQAANNTSNNNVNITNNFNGRRDDPRLIAAEIGFEVQGRLGSI